jgi:glutaminyl-peptide cyclotransferase
MRNYKTIGILVIISVLLGTFVIVPLVKKYGSDTEDSTTLPLAKFKFDQNLAGEFGKILPLEFSVNSPEIKKVELFFQDSLIQTWPNPKGDFKHDLNTNRLSLGSYELSLVSTFHNGDTYTDARLLRILSDVSPTPLTAKIVKSYPHNALHFTQGLEFSDGLLYEGTGDPNGTGETKVMQVKLETGSVNKKIGLDGSYFGEGITILNDKIYQLTYKEQKCFVYDKASFQVEKDFSYSGEGWGLCNDGKNLIMSNGTEYITFRDPNTFQIVKTIQVYDQVGPRVRINELEYVNGKIFANVWMLDLILVIDPVNGKVLNEIDCAEISKVGKGNGDVLNGIAYNPVTNKYYVTGKYWTQLFEISF